MRNITRICSEPHNVKRSALDQH